MGTSSNPSISLALVRVYGVCEIDGVQEHTFAEYCNDPPIIEHVNAYVVDTICTLIPTTMDRRATLSPYLYQNSNSQA